MITGWDLPKELVAVIEGVNLSMSVRNLTW